MENTKLFDCLKEEITTLKKEVSSLKLELQSTILNGQREAMDILKDMVAVLDAFNKAKTVISEKGWDQTEDGQKILARFLNVEKQFLNKMAAHGVKEIPIEVGSIVDDFLCTVSDTEPDPSRENDTIIEIEKKGYTYNDSILRPADVIIVKN